MQQHISECAVWDAEAYQRPFLAGVAHDLVLVDEGADFGTGFGGGGVGEVNDVSGLEFLFVFVVIIKGFFVHKRDDLAD